MHTLTCFLGAFLLFSLEPMLGKALTPRFGGGAQVWMTCLLFFQGVLLLGYLWAFGTVRLLAPRRAAAAHAGLLGAALLLLLGQGLRGLPFLPFWSHPGAAGSPVGLLWVLATAAGLPLAALFTTAPLVQSWYVAKHPDRSPYALYAASNAGSFAGLLCYPFLVEPLLGFPGQAWTALVLFVLYAVLMLKLGAGLPIQAVRPGMAPAPGASWTTRGQWLLASLVGVLILMGVTNYLILRAAAIPLIWVGPLAVYLLTFILVFEGRRAWDDPRLAFLWLSLLALAAGFLAAFPRAGLGSTLVAGHALVFTGGMVCHGFLHRQRPGVMSLTGYYLIIALGGVLGGVLVALVAPSILDRQLEFPLAILLAAGVGALALRAAPESLQRRAWVPVLAALAVGGWMTWSLLDQPGTFRRDY